MPTTAKRMFRYLAEHPHLGPADYAGLPINEPNERNGIGVLYYDPNDECRPWYKRFFLGPSRPSFLGVLFFYSLSGNGDWSFKIMKDEFQGLTLRISKELQREFKVDVRVSVVNKEWFCENLQSRNRV